MNTTGLKVIVPKKMKEERGIVKGSAIVCEQNPNKHGLFKIYYEGNLNGASNLETFEEKLLIASGRLVASYPTIAFDWIKEDELFEKFTVVGQYNPENRLLEIQQADVLENWKG
jgi:hypothetical protein